MFVIVVVWKKKTGNEEDPEKKFSQAVSENVGKWTANGEG